MATWREVRPGGPLVRSRWIFNCYLLDADTPTPTVVDVGLPDHGHAVAAWWTDRFEVGPAVHVVATHGHSDHVCGIPALAASAQVSVAMGEVAARFIDGEVPPGPGPRAVARIAPVMRSQPFELSALVESARAPRVGYGLRPRFAWPLDRPGFLADGDRLGASQRWEVIVTPGHVADSISLYDASSRTLCAGDAVLSAYGRAWITPEICDADAAAATEDRLRALRVDTLLAGHGPPLVGRDLMSSAASHRDAQGWIPTCRSRIRRRTARRES